MNEFARGAWIEWWKQFVRPAFSGSIFDLANLEAAFEAGFEAGVEHATPKYETYTLETEPGARFTIDVNNGKITRI